MDITVIQELVKPELLVLVPVLYLIGMGLKKVAILNDKYIPTLLGLFGVFLAMIYLASTVSLSTPQEILSFVFAGITQGILAAGSSVYINQIYKQATKEE